MNNRYTWNLKRFEATLKANGYRLTRSKGDHNIWTKPGCNHISINRNPNQMVCQRLVKENKLIY